MDFVMDSLCYGCRIKILAIVDDCTKESVDLVVDFGISGHYVTRNLDQAARFRGYPKAIRTDHWPEFTGKALDLTRATYHCDKADFKSGFIRTNKQTARR
jgi:putative transposase